MLCNEIIIPALCFNEVSLLHQDAVDIYIFKV